MTCGWRGAVAPCQSVSHGKTHVSDEHQRVSGWINGKIGERSSALVGGAIWLHTPGI
jgi:hypothetical protein